MIHDIARGRCQPNSARLSPDGLVDFLLITNFKSAGRCPNDENCVAHFAAGAPIFSSHFFPKPNSAQSELGEFLPDLSTKAIFFGLATTLSTTWKHPQPVALSPNQQDFAAPDCNELGGLCHTTNSLDGTIRPQMRGLLDNAMSPTRFR